MEEHGSLLYAKVATLYWEMILKLMGCSTINDDYPHQLIPSNSENSSQTSSFVEAVMDHCQGLLNMYFGFYEHCANYYAMGDAEKSLSTVAPGHPGNAVATFCGGLSSFVCLRGVTGKTNRIYKKCAFQSLSTIQRIAQKGNPNVLHYLSLLDAENAAYHGDVLKAERNYQSAIMYATRKGFFHDAALANERFGDFYQYIKDDKEEATFRIKEAIRLYKEWGSMKKVKLLQEKYRQHLLL